MTDKYAPLTAYLLDAAASGQHAVDMDFVHVAELVGGLPASAATRTWWANNSQSQARAWRQAGFHVDKVYPDRRSVRFAAGTRGAAYDGRGRRRAVEPGKSVESRVRVATGARVEVGVRLQWYDAGTVGLDNLGKLAFAQVEPVAGLYRITLESATDERKRIYIGETTNLHRRLHGNYRTPGPSQKTSLRINKLLLEHLGRGGQVEVAIATSVTAVFEGADHPLDLSRKAGRLLAESAALVLSQWTDDADIENLG